MKIKFRNYGAFMTNVRLGVLLLILLVLGASIVGLTAKLLGLVSIGWWWIFAPWVIVLTIKVFNDVFEVVEDVHSKI